MGPATGTRMGLTVRHVGKAQRRLGRTRDRELELQRQRRTVDVRLPHTGESRACHQNRSTGLERGYVSIIIGDETVNQRHCSPFLCFFLPLLCFGFHIFVGAENDVSQRSGFSVEPHETVARDGRRRQRSH